MTSRFLSYDRTGQQLRDYGPHLDFGAGVTARNVSLPGWPTLLWDVQPLPTTVSGPGRPRGLEEPLRASSIVIGGVLESGGGTKVKLVGASGALVASHTLPGRWDAFRVSPRGGYLYTYGPGPTAGTAANAIFRVSDGQRVWQGRFEVGGFARDESHFVFLPGNPSPGLPRIIDLATGVETVSTSTQIPALTHPGVSYSLDVVLDSLALFRAGWDTYSQLVWAVDWRGQVTRFGLDIPMHATEYPRWFDPTGTKAVLSREGTGSGDPTGPLGAFELDLATKAATTWNGPDFSCLGRPGQLAFKIDGNMVQACSCSDGTCRPIAPLPSGVASGWRPELVVSRDRQTVVLVYTWSSAVSPPSYPEILWLRPDGEVVARFPWAQAEIDDTGQLLVVRPSFPQLAPQLGIVDIATGSVAWINRPVQSAIVYE